MFAPMAIVVGIILLALGGVLNPIIRVTTSPLISAQEWITSRYLALVEFITVPKDTALLRQQNAELESQVSGLQSQNLQLQQQLAEARLANALVDFARAHPENRYLGASVIGRDPSPFLHYILINRGSNDGLVHGMPVVTDQGLVGRIDAVMPNAARVQLISDPASVVGVRLQSTQTEAVLQGSLVGEITLDMLPLETEIPPGEIVMTSGIGGKFPPNILVGQILAVRQEETAIFQQATIQPVVDFRFLKVVLIITNFIPIDLNPLIPTPVP